MGVITISPPINFVIIGKTISGAANDFLYTSVVVAGNGDIYVAGKSRSFGFFSPIDAFDDSYLIKFKSSLDEQFQKGLVEEAQPGGSPGPEHVIAHGCAYDPVDNRIYIVGSAETHDLIARYSNTGTHAYHRRAGGPTSASFACVVDNQASNRDLYVVGDTTSSTIGTQDGTVYQFQGDSAAPSFYRNYGNTGDIFQFRGVAKTSANPPVLGITGFGSGFGQGADMVVGSVNGSDGSINFFRALGSTSDVAQGCAVAISGTDIYAVGQTQGGTGTYDLIVVRYNSSGTLQWQRTLGTTGTTTQGRGIVLDSSGNVYVCAYTTHQTSTSAGVIAKYNSSGTIQWQNVLRAGGGSPGGGTHLRPGGGTSTIGNCLAISPDDNNLYMVGASIDAGWDGFLFRTLTDGSGQFEGTNFSYVTGTLTDAAGSLTETTPTMSDTAESTAVGDPNFNDVTPTLTVADMI